MHSDTVKLLIEAPNFCSKFYGILVLSWHKSSTLDDLERPIRTLFLKRCVVGAQWTNLNDDRPILPTAKCRAMTLVSESIWCMRIFTGGSLSRRCLCLYKFMFFECKLYACYLLTCCVGFCVQLNLWGYFLDHTQLFQCLSYHSIESINTLLLNVCS